MKLHARRNLAYDAVDGIEIWFIEPLADGAAASSNPLGTPIQDGLWIVINLAKTTLDEQVKFFDAAGAPVLIPTDRLACIEISVTQSESLPLDEYVFKAAFVWHDAKDEKNEAPEEQKFSLARFLRRS